MRDTPSVASSRRAAMWCLGLILLGSIAGRAVGPSPPGAHPTESAADATAVVQQFLARHDAPLVSYEGHRVMRARNARFRKEGWLDADVRLDPVGGFTYQVVATGGSPLVVSRVLIPALRGEADMWRNGDPGRSGVDADNYTFVEAWPVVGDGLEEIRISMRPRRTHVLLVDGSLYLSARNADLLRVEGRVSKSPSFWVSRVDVVRRYARVGGVRVPVELQSVAHVRLAGRSEMQIEYFYDAINDLPIGEASRFLSRRTAPISRPAGTATADAATADAATADTATADAATSGRVTADHR